MLHSMASMASSLSSLPGMHDALCYYGRLYQHQKTEKL